MQDPQLKEIERSVKSYVLTFGLEGAEDEIKATYKDNEPVLKTMLFVLYDNYNFGRTK